MSTIDLIALIASIASLILAVGAIWLSIIFFKMSSQASQATTEAAKGIDASVQRLENLFDKLYSDTFSMMKDTVSDMRKHIWNKPEYDRNDISDEMKSEIQSQVLAALDDKSVPEDGKKEEIAKKLETAFEELLGKARENKRTIKSEKLFKAIQDLGPISIEKLADVLGASVEDIVIPHIFTLREKRKIKWGGPKGAISNDTIVEAVDKEES